MFLRMDVSKYNALWILKFKKRSRWRTLWESTKKKTKDEPQIVFYHKISWACVENTDCACVCRGDICWRRARGSNTFCTPYAPTFLPMKLLINWHSSKITLLQRTSLDQDGEGWSILYRSPSLVVLGVNAPKLINY